MSKLKPCPFCGEDPFLVNGKYVNWVFCTKCGAETGTLETEAEAISAWNRRPEPRELTLEELKQMKGCPVWIINPRTSINLGCKVLEIYIGGSSDSRSDRFIFTDRYMIFEVNYGRDAVAFDRPPGR